jgi:Spy/CpxP family protein refolding chaperone
MTKFSLRAAALGAALIAAVPVLAQTPPPSPPGAAMRAGPDAGGRWGHGKGGMMGGHQRAFASMSEAGRQTMWDAMRAGGDRQADREAVKAARDRMLTILEADRLDSGALRRAMDDERNAANASRERHQAAMLAAFGKLTVADRKAFVADSRALKTRMEARMEQWRGKRGAMRGRGGMDGGDMPPMPPQM